MRKGIRSAIAGMALLLLLSGCSAPTGTYRNVGIEPAETCGMPDRVRAIPVAEYESYRELAATYRATGETSSATATDTDLILNWSAEKAEGSAAITLHFTLTFNHPEGVDLPERTLTVTVDGIEEKITTPAIAKTGAGREILYEKTLNKTVLNKEELVSVSASWNYGQSVLVRDYYGTIVPVFLPKLETKARIPVGDLEGELKGKASLPVKNIMQNPELPNGCEITALTITLNYYGFGTDKLTMADQFLPKEEDTYTSDFYETFAGNPRNQKRALGCYAPVIVKSAEAFLESRGQLGSYEIRDLTGASPAELYALLDEGAPVVVWMTQYIDATPRILKTWTAANGSEMNWKHPLHCVVLIGYDRDAGTVTIADPLVGIVTHKETLFALRYEQLGTQAVLVRPASGS